MKISEQQLHQMMPNAGHRLDAHVPFINPALEHAHIDTPDRIAAFLAQLAHESGEYRYMEELADGSAYEGRVDLGNTQPGDGVKFKGHGPIQITGRDAHGRCGKALGIDLIANPTLICTPQYGTASACWFWNDKAGGLSRLADKGWMVAISRLINGGTNGLADRLQYWARNRAVLGLTEIDPANEEASIMAFQLSKGLTADGKIGPRTLAALS